MILGVTGHRPNKIPKYGVDGTRLVAFAKQQLIKFKEEQGFPAIDTVLTGMALGWDMAVAQACFDMEWSYTPVVPCLNQEALWPQEDKAKYLALLRAATVRGDKVIVTSWLDYQSPEQMFGRNTHLVKMSDHVLAFWNGAKGSGGTSHAVGVASALGVPVTNVWQDWIDKGWM